MSKITKTLTVLLQCAQVTTDKKLIRSVLTEMNEMSVKSAMVSLHFRVQVTGQNVSEKKLRQFSCKMLFSRFFAKMLNVLIRES